VGDGAELLSGFSKSKGPIWGHHQNPIDSSPFQGNLKISQKNIAACAAELSGWSSSVWCS